MSRQSLAHETLHAGPEGSGKCRKRGLLLLLLLLVLLLMVRATGLAGWTRAASLCRSSSSNKWSWLPKAPTSRRNLAL